ncbi:MAG: hypothetical protein IRD7MM_06835 [Candidatus Midichloria mitochondrii]|nr:hypothetical protein [Candidatus Midichloria mitochondrii]
MVPIVVIVQGVLSLYWEVLTGDGLDDILCVRYYGVLIQVVDQEQVKSR